MTRTELTNTAQDLAITYASCTFATGASEGLVTGIDLALWHHAVIAGALVALQALILTAARVMGFPPDRQNP